MARDDYAIQSDPLDAHATYEGMGTNPPSITTSTASGNSVTLSQIGTAWDGTSMDLRRCKSAMMRAGRDGKMLELWAQWLGSVDLKGKRTQQWTEDDDLATDDQVSFDSSLGIGFELPIPSICNIKVLMTSHVCPARREVYFYLSPLASSRHQRFFSYLHIPNQELLY